MQHYLTKIKLHSAHISTLHVGQSGQSDFRDHTKGQPCPPGHLCLMRLCQRKCTCCASARLLYGSCLGRLGLCPGTGSAQEGTREPMKNSALHRESSCIYTHILLRSLHTHSTDGYQGAEQYSRPSKGKSSKGKPALGRGKSLLTQRLLQIISLWPPSYIGDTLNSHVDADKRRPKANTSLSILTISSSFNSAYCSI